jgi:hypothetical protein
VAQAVEPAATPAAGLQQHVWGEELYGELLEIGGGKERMTKYFKVRRQQAAAGGGWWWIDDASSWMPAAGS